MGHHIDYGFDETRKAEFARAIKLYYPQLDDSRLQPAYTGIRPKISKAGEPAADFLFSWSGRARRLPVCRSLRHRVTGSDRFIAIAEHVVALLRETVCAC